MAYPVERMRLLVLISGGYLYERLGILMRIKCGYLCDKMKLLGGYWHESKGLLFINE